MGFLWVKWVGWQRMKVTDVTDGFFVGEKSWLATDFLTDVTDGLTINN